MCCYLSVGKSLRESAAYAKAGLWEEKIVQRKRHKSLKTANPAVTAIAHARPIPLPAPVSMPILSLVVLT